MYAGIQRLEVQGAIKDYLKIQYSGSDVLYVPVTQLDLLSRYTAPGDDEKVKLAKLGGTEWQRTRAKVKKATEEMAQELIELYARRRQATGYAFPADASGRAISSPASSTTRRTTSSPPPPRSRRTWKRAGLWTACSAATWASAKRRSPSVQPSSASWAASSAPFWPPPPCWRGSTTTASSPAWRRSR